MSFSSWGSNAGTVSSSGFEDWSSGGWRNRFPDNSGTKTPQTDPERIARIQHLENQIYNLAETVRDCDSKVDAAKQRLYDLKEKLSRTRDRAYQARERHLALGNKKAGLEGKIAGNKNRIRELRDRLNYTRDAYTIGDIKREIENRENNRWTLSDQLSNVTDAYYTATERMNSAENRINELERSVDSANEHVYTCREDCNLKKEKLAEFRNELSRLRSA